MDEELQQSEESQEIDEAAMIAELDDLGEPAADVATEAPAEVEASPEEESEEESELEEGPEEEAVATEPEPEPEDAKAEQRIEKIHAAEKRSRMQLDSERKALEQERAEWAEKMSQFEAHRTSYTKDRDRAKYDPASLLSGLGVTDPEDLMNAARQLHAMAVAGTDKATPEQQAQARAALRSREVDDRISKMEAENQRLRGEIEAKEQSAHTRAQVDAYTSNALEAVSDKSPIVQSMANRSPDDLREKILTFANIIIEQTDEVPDVSDVIDMIEASERKSLTDRGFDPELLLAATKRAKPPVVGEKKPALTSNLSSATPAQESTEAMDEDELEAQILSELSSL